jgi:hypothetical protein
MNGGSPAVYAASRGGPVTRSSIKRPRELEVDLTTAALLHEPIAGRVGVLTGRAGFRS